LIKKSTETKTGIVHNTKSQQNNENCYILTVHLFYGGIVFKHSRDFNCSAVVEYCVLLQLVSVLFYQSSIIPTLTFLQIIILTD